MADARDDRPTKEELLPSSKGKRPWRMGRALRLPSARQVGFAAFAFLMALAIAFPVWWGVSFGLDNVIYNNGVYAVVVTLVGFSLAGMWITLPPKRSAATAA